MKKLYFIISILFIAHFASAGVVITAVVNGGKWNVGSTWDLHRAPVNGDTVVIPGRMRVVVDNNINLGMAQVYVKVNGTLELNGGSLTLGSGSVISLPTGGTVISNSNPDEQIYIGGVMKYIGTEGTIAGAAVANNTTGTSPNGFKSSGTGTLPVKFIGFNLARQQNNVLIDWSTAQETHSASFEVQRSENGSTWNTIATVAAAGYSSAIRKYSYTDYAVNLAVVYYRIRQVDIDGHAEISAVRTLKMNESKLDVKLTAGTNQTIYVHFSEQVKSIVSVKVMNPSGQVIYKTTLTKPVGQQLIPVNSNLRGVYTVTLTDDNNLKSASQILL